MQKSSASRRNSPRRIIWASDPFVGRLGTYIGIALEASGLSVVIRSPSGPRWVPADEALSAAEASAWAASGFKRK